MCTTTIIIKNFSTIPLKWSIVRLQHHSNNIAALQQGKDEMWAEILFQFRRNRRQRPAAIIKISLASLSAPASPIEISGVHHYCNID